MIRRRWLAGGVAGIATIAGASWAWRQRADAGVAAPAGLWEQRFEQPGGGELVLASLRGGPLLLNFWATWCAPCIREMPLLDRFQQQHRASGWQVAGLAIDSPTPVRDYLARLPIGFAIGLAGFGGVELARSLGNSSGALPFTAVFDAGGRLRASHLGALGPEQLADWARRLS